MNRQSSLRVMDCWEPIRECKQVRELEGKVAVITGASMGIGQAIAVELARAGAHVASLHLPGSAADMRTEDEVKKCGRRALMVDGDTADASQMEAFADLVEAELGPVDIWVNNAAQILVRPLLDMTDESWHELLGPNLHGYFYGCRTAVRRMASRNTGRIVNISSITAAQPITEMVAYVTAKGGIVAMTRALAVEVAPLGITVNAVSPGAIATSLNTDLYTDEVRRKYEERIALGRIGAAEDIARVVLFLASGASAYVTGQELIVDGGMTINGSIGFRTDRRIGDPE
jgi:NAD(P)-dependent dehydrogenase (short-subunit alcohol dehydrogenase family)